MPRLSRTVDEPSSTLLVHVELWHDEAGKPRGLFTIARLLRKNSTLNMRTELSMHFDGRDFNLLIPIADMKNALTEFGLDGSFFTEFVRAYRALAHEFEQSMQSANPPVGSQP